jgi:hypothetical protein
MSIPFHIWDQLRCSQEHCQNPVVSIVVAEAGCAVMPDHQVQSLCLQHLISLESAGEVYEIATRIEIDYDGAI